MLAEKRFEGVRSQPSAAASRARRESNDVGFLRLLSRIWDAITSLTRPPNAATLFRRADLYRQEGRFEEAAELVAQGLRLAPSNGVGHLLSAYLHLAFRQIGPAKSELQFVLQADPYHPRALLGLAKIALEERDLAACRPFLDKALQYYPDFPEARALQEMVAGWVTAVATPGQLPAYAGPPLQVEKLRPPAGGREFVLAQTDGTLVFSQQGDKDAEDLAAHVTQVYRIASATLQRAGLGALRRGIVQAATETSFFRSNDRLILALSFPQDVKIGFGLLETDKLWTNSLRELGVRP
jgi:tetratricopeptide (TPR) repeat protein